MTDVHAAFVDAHQVNTAWILSLGQALLPKNVTLLPQLDVADLEPRYMQETNGVCMLLCTVCIPVDIDKAWLLRMTTLK
jgi:hypothetical protein